MNKLIAAIAFVTTLILATSSLTPVHAAETATSATRSEIAQGKGTVVTVDATAGIVNLNHEPIPALKWPAMTMDFKVTDRKLLAGLKPGQSIVFALIKDPVAGYLISRIEAAK